MGLMEALRGQHTYFDANVLIYALDGIPPFAEPLRELVSVVDTGGLRVTTSELSLAEVLVRPFRERSAADVNRYHQLLEQRPHFAVEPVTREILIHAAQVRASSRHKLPDAIHFATALVHGCAVFLTNDAQFRPAPGLEVVILSDVIHA